MAKYIKKNGVLQRIGVIPQGYPASLIEMDNGDSVEDAVLKAVIAKTTRITSDFSSDTAIMDLANGCYSVAISPSTSYLPYRYGVLNVMKSADVYGSFQFFDTSQKKMYYRIGNISDKTWFNSWTQLS